MGLATDSTLTRVQQEAVTAAYTEATIQQGTFLQGEHQHLAQNRGTDKEAASSDLLIQPWAARSKGSP